MKERIIDYILLVMMLLQALLSLLFPLYRDTTWIKDTWFGNDLVTLLVVCPLFLFSIIKSHSRSRILNVGCVGYVIYNYCFYMLGTHLNTMFLVYVLLVILGVSALLIKLGTGDTGRFLDASFDRSKNYVLPAVIFIFIGTGLGAVWIGSWISYTFGQGKLPTDEPAFRLVAALDLVIIVASMIVSGIALVKKKRIGFLLGSTIGVQGLLYLLVLTVNSIVLSVRQNALSSELPIWVTLLLIESVGTGALIVKNGNEVSYESNNR